MKPVGDRSDGPDALVASRYSPHRHPSSPPGRAGARHRLGRCRPAVADELGIDVAAHLIGPAREYQDLYEDWARAREVGEDGCVLVRPDMHVAWRANGMADDPAAELLVVMSRILALPI